MVSNSPSGSPAGIRLARTLGLALLVLALTVVLDRGLGLFGLPSEAPAYPVAPPYYEARIENLEYTYTRKTNDRGIRYPEVPLKKPEGTHRVVLVGDSFTEGACVAVEQRWSSLIEARVGSVELINCGEAGTHPPDYARTLAQLGLDYEPDAVVVGLYFDDVPNTPVEVDPAPLLARAGARKTGLPRVVHALWPHTAVLLTSTAAGKPRKRAKQRMDLIESARQTASQQGIDEATFERWRRAVPEPMLAAVAERKLSPGLLTYSLTRPDFFYEGIGIETEEARARFRSMTRILDAMAELCRQRGIRFGVVLMPSVHQFDPSSSERLMATLYGTLGHPVREEWKLEVTELQRALAAWASESEGLPFLDLVPVFREAIQSAPEPLNFAIDPHWTPAGHELAAGAIQAWMEASGLIPAP